MHQREYDKNSRNKMTDQHRDDTEEQYLQVVQNPSPNDILCGKDKSCVHAPGSIRFRRIIESYRQRYANCLTKFDKMLITKEIYETLSESARFLKYNSKEKVWEEISPMAARDKCGHALRFANRTKTSKKKKNQETQEMAGSTTSGVTSSPQAAPTSGPGALNSVSPTLAASHAPAMLSPAPDAASATISASGSPNTSATTAAHQLGVGAIPQAQQQHLWGELAKRYSSMWNATQICATAPAPSFLGTSTADAITALAAAAVVRSTPSLLGTIANAPSTVPVAAPSSAAANAIKQQALLNAVAAANAAPAPSLAPHPRRKPTLDDLCSILSGEVFAKSRAN